MRKALSLTILWHRNRTKIYICDLGLIESPRRQRRRSADDLVIIGRKESNKTTNLLTSNENINELQEIVHNQHKYIQQLQMRIRVNKLDIIQVSTIEKFNEHIKVNIRILEIYLIEEIENFFCLEFKSCY